MMKDSRKKFESWIRKETGLNLERTKFAMTPKNEQQYLDHSTNLAWFAWVAATTQVELESE